MQSVGNDIVALNAINASRTNTPQFYSKILSASEQQLYYDGFSAMSFHQFVWLLWSVKEAVYKCLQREQPNLQFSPVSTAISWLALPQHCTSGMRVLLESTGFADTGCFKSTITFQTHTFYARSVIYGDELIHTVASPAPDLSTIAWGIKRIEKFDPISQSAAVREFLVNRLQKIMPETLIVEKHSSGFPFITMDGKQLPVSLSHHEDWVGYAFHELQFTQFM